LVGDDTRARTCRGAAAGRLPAVISESALDVPAGPVSEAEAARLVGDLYDLGDTAGLGITPLPGEYDANFRLDLQDGRSFVLKVMHPARERSLIELQYEALAHLRRASPRLPLPEVHKTRTGELVTVATHRTSAEGPPEPPRLVWMLTFVPGRPFADVRPQSDSIIESLGRLLGDIDNALQGFKHPAAVRDFKWDLARAEWAWALVDRIADLHRRSLATRALAVFDQEVEPVLPRLRRSVIHGDANDYNVIVGEADVAGSRTTSLVDFGDMHLGITVAEVAVAAAYACLERRDPLPAIAVLVRAYHERCPLDEDEIAALFPLTLARLAVSVTNSAIRSAANPDDPYVTVSEAPAFAALERLLRIPPSVARATLRHACSFDVVPRAPEVAAWIRREGPQMAPVLDVDLRTTPCQVFDLSVGSPLLGADTRATETPALTDTLFDQMRKSGVSVGVGRYDEARLLYVSPLFGEGEAPTDERRTVHLGVDLFVPPGSKVHAPLEGMVHILANNDAPQDYGPLVVLKHQTDGGAPFFTLYGHLSDDTLEGLKEGEVVTAGQEIARVGAPPSNGDWAPHLHFQLILDLLSLDRDFPGVCRASERGMWTALSPDPNLILGIPPVRFGEGRRSAGETLTRRRRLLGGNLSVSYDRPLKIVRGFGAYLYDESGRAYLDMYNNVPLVGHSHPRVVGAVQAQIRLLNTNTRYLHDHVVNYAERLTALLPKPLEVCYFVNSGSEANDLALRMARNHTGRHDVVVLENAYHGHTSSLIDVSPYKFAGPGGHGRKDFVHVAPMPDDYRGPHRRDDPEAGVKYAHSLAELLTRLREGGHEPAAFLAETLPSVGGQIVPPPRYLAETYRHVREAGGLCIADEVQTGFGRLGEHFWGFEMLDAVPDLVVLGKPIGNAFPLGAVITTRAVAQSFDNGMEFFSTFGGNPVACAAGLAVLDVLRDERLGENATRVGRRLIEALRGLMEKHALIGDVRGAGLFLGVEFVLDRETRTPAPRQARYIVNRLRDLGVLTGTDGPHENVIKLRPPLVLNDADADLFVATLSRVLGEDGAGIR
jgi:4-aminobutyrate aminotransferase-like enzyme/Ser/Thr protein kinase RdoA (MazF antagonist)